MSGAREFETLVEGESLGEFGLSVAPDAVAGLIFANTGEESDAPGAVPPSFVLVLVLRTVMGLELIPPGGVLVGHRIRLLRPFELGQSLKVEVTAQRVWRSRGRPFATLRLGFREGEAEVCVDEMTAIWPVDGSTETQRLPQLTSASGTVVTQGQVERYAEISDDRNPLHLDAEFAARGPFGERVVHGVIPAGVMLDAWAAKHPEELLRDAVRLSFLSPLRPGEPFEVTIDADGGGQVTTVADQRVSVTLASEEAGPA